MRTPSRVALLVLAGLCAVPGTARAAEPSEGPAAEQVREATRKAIGFLKDQIKTRQRVLGLGGGVWGPYGERPGALASQAVLALLEAGVKPEDAGLAEALDYLRSVRPGLTYALSLQTQALCRADPKKDAGLIRHNVYELLHGARREAGRLVGWDRGKGEYFGKTPPVTAEDTWFAVMALHAASQAGVRVEGKTWEEIRAYYLQGPDTLGPGPAWRRVCGLLVTAQELRLDGDDEARRFDARAVDMLTAHFRLPPGDAAFDLLGVLACVHKLAGKNLPAEQQDALRACCEKGVQFLLRQQNKDGSWGDRAVDDGPWGDRAGWPVRCAKGGLTFLAEMRSEP